MLRNEDLYILYERYNELYFKKQLPPIGEITLAFSGRLRAAAGVCYPQRKIIRLSTHYHTKFPIEVGSTLLHEMIHLVTRKHGADFKSWIEQISLLGGSVEIHARERATAVIYKWKYCCQDCGQKYPRKKRLREKGRYHRCGKCRGKLWEESIVKNDVEF